MILHRSSRIVVLLAAVAVTAAVAACGGSSSSSTPKLHARVVPNPNTVTTGSKKGVTIAANTPNPCQLVTAAEAAAILKAPSVKETEAPLGPTCILSPAGQKKSATISVQTIVLSRDLKEMKGMATLSIGGHKAYCGTIGNTVLLAPLLNHQVLNVAAPCPQAAELAAKALGRIKT
jgi:hypothetical protein